MSNNHNGEGVEAIQSDRDAAAALIRTGRLSLKEMVAADMEEGRADDSNVVQAFAIYRHSLAREPATAEVERVARLLCEQHGGDPDAVATEPHDMWDGALWTAFADDAQKLTAVLSGLTEPAIAASERLRSLVNAVEAGNFNALDAVADQWAESAGVQRMMNAMASVFEKHASQEIMDRFREKLGALMHLAFVEGAAQGVMQIATPSTPPASERATVGVREAVPAGIYYSHEHSNFYDAVTNRGKGQAFWETWRDRRHDFPNDVSREDGA